MAIADRWHQAPDLPARTPGHRALRLRGATRAYAGRPVLGPVDLDLEPGAVALVEGPNGAGKTTLLRLACGLLLPTTGTCQQARPALYVRPGSGARAEQTVGQALGWVARATTGRATAPAVALAAAGLSGSPHRRVGTLSAGQQARLSLALALVAGPALACLDEPAAHLDRAGVAHLSRVVAVLAASGCAVLLAMPIRVDFGLVADAHLRLDHGRLEVRP